MAPRMATGRAYSLPSREGMVFSFTPRTRGATHRARGIRPMWAGTHHTTKAAMPEPKASSAVPNTAPEPYQVAATVATTMG